MELNDPSVPAAAGQMSAWTEPLSCRLHAARSQPSTPLVGAMAATSYRTWATSSSRMRRGLFGMNPTSRVRGRSLAPSDGEYVRIDVDAHHVRARAPSLDHEGLAPGAAAEVQHPNRGAQLPHLDDHARKLDSSVQIPTARS